MQSDGPTVAYMGSDDIRETAHGIGSRQPKRKHAIVRGVGARADWRVVEAPVRRGRQARLAVLSWCGRRRACGCHGRHATGSRPAAFAETCESSEPFGVRFHAGIGKKQHRRLPRYCSSTMKNTVEARHDHDCVVGHVSSSRRTGRGYTDRERDHTSEQKGLLRTWPRQARRCSGRYRWAPVSADPPSAAGTCICWTATRRSATRCACSIWRVARSCGRSPTTRPAASCSPARARRRPSTANTSTPSDPWAICTRSTRRRGSPPGSKNIWKDFGGDAELPRWAIVQNPLIHGDLLIVAPQTAEAGVVAYDKRTGAIKWKSAALSGIPGYVHALHRQGRRRGSSRHDHRRRRSRPQRQGRQRQRSGSAQRQGAVDLHRLAVHHPGSAGGRRRPGPRAHHRAAMAPARR